MSDHHFKACVECIQRCVLQHQQQEDPSPIILRFFKILQNEEYSEILYLPPAFALKVQHLVDQEIYLEVSSGQRWTVKISKVGNSLAFHKGWNEFFMHQSLMVGQFLEFHYIKGSHFLVRKYGRGGCEKINFNCGQKKARIEEKIAVQDEQNQMFETIPNAKPKKRVGRKKKKSHKTDAREEPSQTLDVNTRDKLTSSICKHKKESQIRRKAGQWKSTFIHANTGVESELNEVLVDVPIVSAENYNWGASLRCSNIKILANFEDERNGIMNEVSDFQKGEASNAVPDAGHNPTMETEDAGNKPTTEKECNEEFFSAMRSKDSLAEIATESRQMSFLTLDGKDDALVTEDAANNSETDTERIWMTFPNLDKKIIAKSLPVEAEDAGEKTTMEKEGSKKYFPAVEVLNNIPKSLPVDAKDVGKEQAMEKEGCFENEMLDHLQAKSIAEGNLLNPIAVDDIFISKKSGCIKELGVGSKLSILASVASSKKLNDACKDCQEENSQLQERLVAAESQLAKFNARMATQDRLLQMLVSSHDQASISKW